MSKYIDVEFILKEAENAFSDMGDYEWLNRITEHPNAPSIDIVRCGECVHWEESQYYPEFMVCTYVKGATFTRQHDDFCSRGERREP